MKSKSYCQSYSHHKNHGKPVSTGFFRKVIILTNPGDFSSIWKLWEEDLEFQGLAVMWKRICQKVFHFKCIKFRSFYLRYINRAYITDKKLFRMKRRDNPNCQFCTTGIASRIHMFWECPQVQNLWTQVIAMCKKEIAPHENYSKNKCVLFGFDTPLLNLIMLLVKYVIHLGRCFQRDISFLSFLRTLRSVRSRERNAHRYLPSLTTQGFHAYWGPMASYTFPQLLQEATTR